MKDKTTLWVYLTIGIVFIAVAINFYQNGPYKWNRFDKVHITAIDRDGQIIDFVTRNGITYYIVQYANDLHEVKTAEFIPNQLEDANAADKD